MELESPFSLPNNQSNLWVKIDGNYHFSQLQLNYKMVFTFKQYGIGIGQILRSVE